MSTTQPPQPPTSSKPNSQAELIHNVSLAAAILCPIIILLPPRKLDTYTILLAAGTFAGCNQLALEYTGRSIVDRIQSKLQSTSMTPGAELPEKAKIMQARLREEKAAMLRQRNGISHPSEQQDNSTVLEALRKQEDEKKRALLQRLWMGGESADWKQKRDEREKKALEEGKGYGDLIMEQIWEVVNWGPKENKEAEHADEKDAAEKNQKR
ncbi:hypothetical protein F5884DRAFT_800405 [Xylogone sp. PMI_703]|nr:hypothetical protein F5884DRAFT_800405 [Xylogone sp. PMI_703]